MEKTYDFKTSGSHYMVSLHNQTEIVESLTQFCTDHTIEGGSITGLGAVREITLRFFDPATKQYVDRTFRQQMELANLTGNISLKEGKTYLHLHATVAGADYKTYAGHLHSAWLNGAGEFVIEDFKLRMERVFDSTGGLNRYNFKETTNQ